MGGMTESKKAAVIAVSAIALVLAALGALAAGRFHVPPLKTLPILLGRIAGVRGDWTGQMENVVFRVRLPRVCAAILTGSALSVSGAVYQGVFRNPLVSPGLLGASSGSCVGAAAAILLHLRPFAIQLFALSAGVLAVALAALVSRLLKNGSALMLVLSGVIVSGFMDAILGALKYMADRESELAAIVFWTMGSLASVKPLDVLLIAPGILLALFAVMMFRWRINILALDDDEAVSLGVNIRMMRGVLVLCSTALTSLAVCVSGAVGWVGLAVPHLARLLAGNDNRMLLPLSAVIGALFMLAVDTLARTVSASEIPLSVLTGIIGTPLFVWLLVIRRTEARL
jgi:iron complex transport system permease protein